MDQQIFGIFNKVLSLETNNKFIKKSLISFKAGKFYQAEREFTNGLLRDLESKSYQSIETSFKLILPVLEENSLHHESEQVMQDYLYHVRKHKEVKKGLKPATTVITSNISSNMYPNCTVRFVTALLDFAISSQEPDVLRYIEENSLSLVEMSKDFTFHSEILDKIFSSLITLAMYEQLESIAESYYLKELRFDKLLPNVLFSLLILAINGKSEKSLEILKILRKEIPLETQKNSDVFQCSSEFLLACTSKDYDWVLELQQHFSETLKEKTIKILIVNLIKKYFPEETKVSLFDIFKI